MCGTYGGQVKKRAEFGWKIRKEKCLEDTRRIISSCSLSYNSFTILHRVQYSVSSQLPVSLHILNIIQCCLRLLPRLPVTSVLFFFLSRMGRSGQSLSDRGKRLSVEHNSENWAPINTGHFLTS